MSLKKIVSNFVASGPIFPFFFLSNENFEFPPPPPKSYTRFRLSKQPLRHPVPAHTPGEALFYRLKASPLGFLKHFLSIMVTS